MLGTKTCGVLALVITLSGCSDVPGVDPASEETGDDGLLSRMNVDLLLELDEVDAGVPVNLTLEASSAAEVVLDLLNATWSIRVVTVGDAGNATVDANATVDLNATADPVLGQNGTGLPFAGNLTVPANGTYRVTATVEAAGFEAGIASRDLVVLASGSGVDPCAGFRPQEPFVVSGSVLLPGDSSTHELELLPCHTRMVGSISFSPGSVDNDWALFDPAGQLVSSAASFEAGTEGDLEAKDAAGLAAGTWTVQVDNFASVTQSYDIEFVFE